MKIDFLKEGSEDCPLVRIYDFDRAEVQQLCGLFKGLAKSLVQQARLDFAESVDGTELTFSCDSKNKGLIKVGERQFEVILTTGGWLDVAGLAEPFCEGTAGYQWLLPQTRGIQLLLSNRGDW
jgi:hypothetical protein